MADFYITKAAKEHNCEVCRLDIEPASHYLRIEGVRKRVRVCNPCIQRFAGRLHELDIRALREQEAQVRAELGR